MGYGSESHGRPSFLVSYSPCWRRSVCSTQAPFRHLRQRAVGYSVPDRAGSLHRRPLPAPLAESAYGAEGGAAPRAAGCGIAFRSAPHRLPKACFTDRPRSAAAFRQPFHRDGRSRQALLRQMLHRVSGRVGNRIDRTAFAAALGRARSSAGIRFLCSPSSRRCLRRRVEALFGRPFGPPPHRVPRSASVVTRNGSTHRPAVPAASGNLFFEHRGGCCIGGWFGIGTGPLSPSVDDRPRPATRINRPKPAASVRPGRGPSPVRRSLQANLRGTVGAGAHRVRCPE